MAVSCLQLEALLHTPGTHKVGSSRYPLKLAVNPTRNLENSLPNRKHVGSRAECRQREEIVAYDTAAVNTLLFQYYTEHHWMLLIRMERIFSVGTH